MVDLLVGISHGDASADIKVNNGIRTVAVKIVRGMQPGQVLGIEWTQGYIDFTRVLDRVFRAEKHRDCMRLIGVAMQRNPSNKLFRMLRDDFTQDAVRAVAFWKSYQRSYPWAEMVLAADKKGVAVVPLLSAKAFEFKDRFMIELREAELALHVAAASRDEVRIQGARQKLTEAYEHLADPFIVLGERGMFQRLERYNPNVAFLGFNHVEYFGAHTRPELERLGLTQPHQIRFLATDAERAAVQAQDFNAAVLRVRERRAVEARARGLRASNLPKRFGRRGLGRVLVKPYR